MAEHKRSVEVMLSQYRELIERFVKEKISADDFEEEYIRTFTNDKSQVPGSEFIVLEKLFFDVDDYVSDPVLRDSPEDLSGEQLRERAAATYSKLFGLD
ncbi:MULTISPECIES: colicin immunity domain-containing protein [Nocardiaceae]|uniref:Colicin immunity domain-containing protein n=1 Tax=Rhodococcoides yunnanense TaxID=278209 RepID=A0ABU4BI16_9NOCA|nr:MULTISPECIES: colicin immunity domain-containing protein [Rhodococcus]MDI9896059.1 colicin immunity domain-containing protein [Rhodococcus sp. IEGM 1381]MDV6263823.1 colicin immunity domain-containing protein [Rhodococcus yunnanensis]